MINQSVLENNINAFLIIGERHDANSVESYMIGLNREGEQNYIKRLSHISYYKKMFY